MLVTAANDFQAMLGEEHCDIEDLSVFSFCSSNIYARCKSKAGDRYQSAHP